MESVLQIVLKMTSSYRIEILEPVVTIIVNVAQENVQV